MLTGHEARQFEPAIRAEQMRTLFRHHPLSLIGTTVVALMAWFVLEHEVDRGALMTWAAAIAALVAIRTAQWLAFRRKDRADETIHAWGRAAVALAGASGIVWGMLPVMFVRAEEPFTMINIVIMSVGMLAGSLISQSVYLPAYLAFSVPLALALSGSVHVFGGEYRQLALLGYAFSLVIIGFARNSSLVFRRSIETRFENRRLIDELQIQKADAEAANNAKSQFLAAASHDLRQPLHSLGLYAGALADAATTDRQRELTGKMALAIKALEQLFQRILEISQLDAGVVTAQVRDVRLADVVRRLELRYAAVAEQRGLPLHVVCGDEVARTDALLLERILDNLLANAFRYTDDGEITLAVTAQPDHLDIAVRDTGRGIPPDMQERIFEEFYQLDNPERDRQKGLGLGLSIVRRLCALLDHPIRVEPGADRGTEFRLRVPRGDPDRVGAVGDDAAAFGWELTGTRVLVIDDEQDVREAMRAQLESWGCRVQTADTAQRALAEAGAAPQIVIADYRLREHASGIDAVADVRERFGQDIPALLMTGDTDPQRLRQASRSGLQVVHKPVSPGKLRMLVNRLATGGP